MSFDNHANLAVSTIATQPSPATSGTSLVVASGDGAIFPAAPFNATVWPADETPTLDNAEIIRVTGKSTDTFTIVRAQEGTTARVMGAGDQIAHTVTAKTLTDIETASWPESQLSTSDVTTANVTTSKHGFTPKAPNDTTKFLRGDATWAVPSLGSVTESDISLSDVTTDNVSNTKHGFAPKAPADATKFLNGATTPAYAQVKDSDLSTTDITTNNVSISKHGFAPKAPNDATKYLDGTGAYSIPAGTGSGVSSVDSIAGAVSLVAGSNITISDNTPSAGDITIAASGGSSGIVQVSQVSRTSGDLTTSSSSFIDATSLTTTITTGAHRCLVIFSASGHNNTATDNVCVDLAIDGTRQGQSFGLQLISGTENSSLGFTYLTAALSAASHTFKIQWRVDFGTGTMWASTSVAPAILTVIELGI